MTRKAKTVLVLLPLVVLLLTLSILFYGKKNPETYSGAHFGIERYISAVDKDADGVDDQSDIFAAACKYLETAPKYKSKYYEGGYPDDGQGVCTDVIAFALRDAGYDLMELVDADIRARPEAYPNIETPDKNIDFRRVQNLKPFFAEKGVALTLNTDDIAAFQPGDILIFEKHIALVSDKRDENGHPYILHHANPWQKSYEQPLSAVKQQLTGHYRVS